MDLDKIAHHTKVVILDNNEEEGREVQKALDQNGVASHFHHFKDKTEISKIKSFSNARLIFLDLELDNTTRDPKIKANTTLTCLSKLVEPSSYYVLVVWSGELNTELSKRFLSILKTQGKDFYPCVSPILLNKKLYSQGKDFNYRKLRKDIKDALKAVSFFGLFSEWEYQIDDMVSSFLRELLGKEDVESISRKINSLAEAYNGKYATGNPGLYALLTLNNALRGSLDSASVENINFRPINSLLQPGIFVEDTKEKARINSLLMINKDGSNGPGSVYKVIDTAPTFNLKKRILSETKLKTTTGMVKIKIDITPLCDDAQDKAEYRKYIHGFLVPDSVSQRAYDKKKNPKGELVKKLEFAYEQGNVFLFEDKLWKLVVDLRVVETIPANDRAVLPPKKSVWFKFNDGIVLDLQHRSSAHASRPGHSLLN